MERKLTPRQRQICDLLIQGLGNKQIAAQLGICTNTVKAHLTRIYLWLDVQNRRELAERYRATL